MLYLSIQKDIKDKGCPFWTPPISMYPDEVVSADTISLHRRGFQYDNPFVRTIEFHCVLSSMGWLLITSPYRRKKEGPNQTRLHHFSFPSVYCVTFYKVKGRWFVSFATFRQSHVMPHRDNSFGNRVWEFDPRKIKNLQFVTITLLKIL